MSNSSVSSGLLTTSTLLFTGKNYLKGVKLLSDGTNPATVTIYDNTSAAGKILYRGSVAGAALAAPLDDWSHMVQAEIGLFVQITGTGANAIVYFG